MRMLLGDWWMSFSLKETRCFGYLGCKVEETESEESFWAGNQSQAVGHGRGWILVLTLVREANEEKRTLRVGRG